MHINICESRGLRLLVAWLTLCLGCLVGRAGWAEPAGGSLDPYTVLLRSGVFYRGTLVERIRDDSFVLLLPDGARVQVKLSEVLDETDEQDPPFQRSALVIGADGQRRSGEVVRYEPGVTLLLSSAPTSPIPLSAGSRPKLCFIDTREVLIFLSDESAHRGVVVDRVEDSHLVLLTPEGALRTLQLSAIRSQVAAPPGDGRALATLTSVARDVTGELISYEPGKRLVLRSSTKGLHSFSLGALDRVTLPPRREYAGPKLVTIKSPRPVALYSALGEQLCANSQCLIGGPTDAEFTASGPGIRPSKRFTLPSEPRLTLHISPGQLSFRDSARKLLGIGGFIGGVGVVTIFGSGIAIGVARSYSFFDCLELTPSEYMRSCRQPGDFVDIATAERALIAGAGLLAGGGVLLLAAGILHATSRTSVRIVTTPGVSGPRMPLGQGLYLTGSGLAF